MKVPLDQPAGKISDKIYLNKYTPEVISEDLPWNKKDSLMKYIDRLKYKVFISNPDSYLEKAEVINFDMIYARCGHQPQQYSDKHYQTVCTSDVSKMSQKEKRKPFLPVFAPNARIFVWKKN